MFILQLIIGTLLIGITVSIHAVALDRLMASLETISPVLYRHIHIIWRAALLIFTVSGIFLAHIAQIWIWAFFYILSGALSGGLEEALYFSTTTFTTVGYGDIVLDPDWRLVSSFQAANGFILFGWSTAFIFEVMSKLYKDETIKKW